MASGAAEAGAQAGKSKAPKRNFASRVFGYDLFVSFALGPPPRGTHSYASDLARRLRERDFTVFFSEDEAPPGEQLDSTLLKALYRSRTVVVIANRGTLQEPRWVRQEVEAFRSRHPDRPIIPISVGGALQDTTLAEQTRQWLAFDDKIWLDESHDAVAQGIASDETVARLALVPAGRSTNVKWRWVVRATVTALIILSSAATGFGIYARKESKVATAKAREAQENADRADDNAKKARASATEAEKQRDKAVEEAKIAKSRQLAAQAGVIRSGAPTLLERSTLLAVESLHRSPLFESEQALRESLALLLEPRARVECKDNVYAVAFSRDGHYLVAGSGDGSAWVLEVPAGKVVSRLNVGRRVDAVAFSPNERLVATGAEDGSARVFEALTGNEIARFLEHSGSLETVTFSPDGRYLATASRDGTARIFDPLSRKQVFQFKHGNAVWTAAFSPDSHYLATGDGDGGARVFEVATGKQLSQLSFEDSINAVLFSPDGRAIAGASDDNSVRLFEATTGKELARMYHPSSVSSVAFSPDGRYLATGTHDGTGRVFEVARGREVSRLVHTGFANNVYHGLISRVTFSPDGRSVATASHDRTARIFDAETGQEIARVVHGDTVTDVAFSPDGRYLATSSFDHIVRLLETAGANALARFLIPILTGTLAFSPDGKRLALIDRIWNSLPIFEAETGKQTLDLKYRVVAAAFSSDGSQIAVAGQDKTARIFESMTGKELLQLAHHEGELYDVAFSPDGQYLATSSVFVANNRSYTALRLFDARTGRQLWRLNRDSVLTLLAVSSGGRYVAGGFGSDPALWLFEPRSGRRSAVKHDGGLLAIEFSPNGEYLAIGCGDGTARVYETSNGTELMQISHDGPVHTVAFSPDGRYVATGSEDRTARVYEIRSGDEVSRMQQQYPVYAVAFTKDGRFLLTAATALRDLSSEIVIHRDLLRPKDLINLACQRLTRNLTLKEWNYYLGAEPYHETCSDVQ